MSEMCFYTFLASFSNFSREKNCPVYYYFHRDVCLCVFHTRAKFYQKKYPHPTF